MYPFLTLGWPINCNSRHGNGKREAGPTVYGSRAERMHPLFDLLCLSHLRWDFVYQRPQHLLSRCARERRVFFVEEPVFEAGLAHLEIRASGDGPWIVVPHLPESVRDQGDEADALQRNLLDGLLVDYKIDDFVLWYYTPMALGYTRHLSPSAIVYDCMDELSAFLGAPPAMRERERELFQRADLVFTGGPSLYQAKRRQHGNVHLFPSSVDAAHFARARSALADPADQAPIPHPRLGFFGVIDERLDRELLRGVAEARPDWQLILIGPVVKIDPMTLPRRDNIHYLGAKSYQELPEYLAHWDVALLPFAHNDATRFISPTKTPEYLAAGKPVVSTGIQDVLHLYGERGLVHIGDTVPEFVAAVEAALQEDRTILLRQVDALLADNSWDRTWAAQSRLIQGAVAARSEGRPASPTRSDAACVHSIRPGTG